MVQIQLVLRVVLKARGERRRALPARAVRSRPTEVNPDNHSPVALNDVRCGERLSTDVNTARSDSACPKFMVNFSRRSSVEEKRGKSASGKTQKKINTGSLTPLNAASLTCRARLRNPGRRSRGPVHLHLQVGHTRGGGQQGLDEPGVRQQTQVEVSQRGAGVRTEPPQRPDQGRHVETRQRCCGTNTGTQNTQAHSSYGQTTAPGAILRPVQPF